jgi:flavin reductase ActVB
MFRTAMRSLPTGVVLVVVDFGEKPWAMTVSACCSLSATPPRLLVSLSRHTVTLREILQKRRFGVNILSSDQQALAEFGAAPGAAKFLAVEQLDARLARDRQFSYVYGALAYFECAVAAFYEVGDHEIVVADVEEVVMAEDGRPGTPLVYFQAAFTTTLNRDVKSAVTLADEPGGKH